MAMCDTGTTVRRSKERSDVKGKADKYSSLQRGGHAFTYIYMCTIQYFECTVILIGNQFDFDFVFYIPFKILSLVVTPLSYKVSNSSTLLCHQNGADHFRYIGISVQM